MSEPVPDVIKNYKQNQIDTFTIQLQQHKYYKFSPNSRGENVYCETFFPILTSTLKILTKYFAKTQFLSNF